MTTFGYKSSSLGFVTIASGKTLLDACKEFIGYADATFMECDMECEMVVNGEEVGAIFNTSHYAGKCPVEFANSVKRFHPAYKPK